MVNNATPLNERLAIATAEEHQKVVTEGQLKWAQFHFKRRAQEVKQKTEELWQTPGSVSDVEGAESDDGNTTEETLSVVDDGGEPRLVKRKKKKKEQDSSKPSISRGRRALLRVSKRAFAQRRDDVQKNGFRCSGDETVTSDGENSSVNEADDEALAAQFADENAWKKARRKRRQSRRRKTQSTEQERLRRFENAFRAMMMSLQASQPQHPELNIATPTKVWSRPDHVPSLLSIDGRQYQDLKWGVTASHERIGQLMTTTDFANMPVDRRASWLIHIPSKPQHHHQGYAYPGSSLQSDGRILVPENSHGNRDRDLPVSLGSDKFNEIVGTLQRHASNAQEMMEYELQHQQRRNSTLSASKWQLSAHATDFQNSVIEDGQYNGGDDIDEYNSENLKSIAAQYLTAFMANADEEHLIAVLGEKYRDDVETLVEAASEPGKSASAIANESKDIVRRYLDALKHPKTENKGQEQTFPGSMKREVDGSKGNDTDDDERKSLHQDQMASFADIAARYLAEASRSCPTQRPVETHRAQQGVIVKELKQYLENLNDTDDAFMASMDQLSSLPLDQNTNQCNLESIIARYLAAKGDADCKKSDIVSELQLREGREFTRLVTQYLAGIHQAATAAKKNRDIVEQSDNGEMPPHGNVGSRYMQNIARSTKENLNNESSNYAAEGTTALPLIEDDRDQRTFEGIAMEYLADSTNSDAGSTEVSCDVGDVYAELRKETRSGFSKLVTKYMGKLRDSAAAKKEEIEENHSTSIENNSSSNGHGIFSNEEAIQDRLGTPTEEDQSNQRTFEAIIARYLATAHGKLDEDAVFEELGKKERQCFSRIVSHYLSEMMAPGVANYGRTTAQHGGTVTRYLESLQEYPRNQHALLTPKEQKQQDTLEKVSSQYLEAVLPGVSKEAVVAELRRPEREGFVKLVTSYLAAVNDTVLEEHGDVSDSTSAVSLAESNVSLHLKNWRSRFSKTTHAVEKDHEPYDATTLKNLKGASRGGIAARYISSVIDDCEEDDIFAELRKQESPKFTDQETLTTRDSVNNNGLAGTLPVEKDILQPGRDAQDARKETQATPYRHIKSTTLINTARLCLAKIRVDCDEDQMVQSLGTLGNCDKDRQVFSSALAHLLSDVSESTVRRKVDKHSRASASRYLAAMRGLSDEGGSENTDASFAPKSATIESAVNLLMERMEQRNPTILSTALRRLGQEDAEAFSSLVVGYLNGSLLIEPEHEQTLETPSQDESDVFQTIRGGKAAEHKDVPPNCSYLDSYRTADISSTENDKSVPKGASEPGTLADISSTKNDKSVLMEASEPGTSSQSSKQENPPRVLKSTFDKESNRIGGGSDSYTEEKKMPDQHSRSSSLERPGASMAPNKDANDSENFPLGTASFEHIEKPPGPSEPIISQTQSFATNSEFSPDRLREFHNNVMERSALLGQGESEQTIIDTDGTTSEASDALSPRNLAGLMLTPAILTKRHRQAITAIEGRRWEQATYLLSANPWLAEMPEIGTNQYLLHKLALFGAGDSQHPSAPDQLCMDLVKMFPAIHKFDSDGNLPLHMASKSSNMSMIKILGDRFSSGASVRNEDGMLPLHLAITFAGGDNLETDTSIIESIKTLLGYFPGAVAVADNEGNLPIHSAAKLLDGKVGIDCINLLLDEAEKQLDDPNGARFHNKTKIDDGESVSATTEGDAALSECDDADVQCQSLHCAMVVNNSGDTPLSIAVKRSASSALTQALLVAPGGNDAALMQDFEMNNALHMLLGMNHVEVDAIKAFLQVAREAALERNMDRMLPIEVACLKGAAPEIVLELVLVDLPISLDDKFCVKPIRGGESWWYLTCECQDNYLSVVEEVITLCTYQQVQELCFMSNQSDETVVACASPECGEFLRVALLFVGRYELLGSATTTQVHDVNVIDALDYGTADAPLEEGKRVTLNCYTREEMYSEKIAVLKSLELDFTCVEQVSCFVVGERDSYDSGGNKQYCVAVEKPSLTLDRVVAGMLKNEACQGQSELRKRYVAKIFSVLRMIARSLHRLHSFGIIHGDVCAQKCGKFDDNWKLLGTLKLQKVGTKFDTAYFGPSVPPEALEPKSTNVALDRQAAFRTNIVCDPSIDLWGFGRLAYDALVGEPLVQFDTRKEVSQDHRALLKILNWSTLDLVEARRKLRHAGVPDLGVDLIARCLSQDTDSRPTNMNEILRSDLWHELHRPESIEHQNSDLHEC